MICQLGLFHVYRDHLTRHTPLSYKEENIEVPSVTINDPYYHIGMHN